MIPYFAWHTITLGPIDIQVWGLFVGLGFLLAAFVAGRLAKRRGLDPKIIYDLTLLMVLGAIVGGRLGHVFFYAWPYYSQHLLEILEVWRGGLSMFGGLIVCALLAIWYLRRRQVDLAAYADVVAFGLPFGFMIGRIGCFLIHDHPGTATHFFLGVQYPGSVVRHDLGLYEAINGAGMAMVFLILVKKLGKKAKPGLFLGLFCLWYGVFRVVTDGLRLVDVRYLGLTPGQYFGIILALVGLRVLWITKVRKQQ